MSAPFIVLILSASFDGQERISRSRFLTLLFIFFTSWNPDNIAGAMGEFILGAKASLDPKPNAYNACFVSAAGQRSKGKQARKYHNVRSALSQHFVPGSILVQLQMLIALFCLNHWCRASYLKKSRLGYTLLLKYLSVCI